MIGPDSEDFMGKALALRDDYDGPVLRRLAT
jgi:hypothetical protein